MTVVGMVVAEGYSGERGRGKREKFQKPGKMAGFWSTLDSFSPPSGYEIHFYL
jgi:hypothetical protein